MAIISLKIWHPPVANSILLHSLISGANCFILQIPMLSLGLFTRDVYIIAQGKAEGNNVNVEAKESQV